MFIILFFLVFGFFPKEVSNFLSPLLFPLSELDQNSSDASGNPSINLNSLSFRPLLLYKSVSAPSFHSFHFYTCPFSTSVSFFSPISFYRLILLYFFFTCIIFSVSRPVSGEYLWSLTGHRPFQQGSLRAQVKEPKTVMIS